jgi:predicted nucleic acid-binding protein
LTACVIDASVAAAWCFKDEASPSIDAVFRTVRDYGALVPALWHLELANALLQAERRRRILIADLLWRLDLISDFPIVVDAETPARAWRETLLLARTERLTTYDAAYLEVALRMGLPLASLDTALVAAAKRLGTIVLP